VKKTPAGGTIASNASGFRGGCFSRVVSEELGISGSEELEVVVQPLSAISANGSPEYKKSRKAIVVKPVPRVEYHEFICCY
jgi:hypothetical protein